MEKDFEAGAEKAIPFIRSAKGCKGIEVQRSIETPTRYWLFVQWETLENHTEEFRGSPGWQEWRKLVAHCFAQPPQVEYGRVVTRAA
jgi:heme-degrading monooxygenase HmoA